MRTSMRYSIYTDKFVSRFDGLYTEFWTDHIPVCSETFNDLGKAKAALIEALKDYPDAYIRGEFRSTLKAIAKGVERHYLTKNGKLRMEKTDI